jgi:hypothetical protein
MNCNPDILNDLFHEYQRTTLRFVLQNGGLHNRRCEDHRPSVPGVIIIVRLFRGLRCLGFSNLRRSLMKFMPGVRSCICILQTNV